MAGNTEKQRQNLGRPWAPGQSGNVSGRSKAANELRKALEQDAPYARQRIRELIDSPDDQVALKAAVFVVEQVKGRAVQAFAGDDGGPVKVDFGLVEMLRKLAAP